MRGLWPCPACSLWKPPSTHSLVNQRAGPVLIFSGPVGPISGVATACLKMLSSPPPLPALLQEDHGAAHLTDNQTCTFWESNGDSGQHWVRLNMKKGAIVK